MNKTELTDAIAIEARLLKVDAKKAVETFFPGIERAPTNGDKASIIGFGARSVAEREAGDARNPRTGEVVKVPVEKVVKLKAETESADAVNK